MELADIIVFAGVAALLVMSPGPNGVLIARTVPTSGRSAGLANVAGFVAAFYLHGALSILGISIILLQSAVAFMIVKYLGAAYLFWIGVRALMTAYRGGESDIEVTPAKRERTLRMAFIEGFLTNALNPKVTMFYLAAFPQFISAGEATAASSFLLVTVHSAMNAIWFTAMVLLFANLAKAARSGRFKRWLHAITGFVFVGFAVKLASFKPSY